MLRSVKKKVNGQYYYFQKGGKAARDKWVKVERKYYYFRVDGTMAVSQTVDEYLVGADGARHEEDPGQRRQQGRRQGLP